MSTFLFKHEIQIITPHIYSKRIQINLHLITIYILNFSKKNSIIMWNDLEIFITFKIIFYTYFSKKQK